MALIAAGAALAYGLGNWWWGSLRWGVRWSLCAVMGGILGYLYVAGGLPGSKAWVQGLGTPGILGVALMGVVAGWLFALGWWIMSAVWLGRKTQKSR
jgi:beta-N-acetylhexosaminidase